MAGTQVRFRFFSWGQSLGQLETQSRDLQRLPWNDQRGPFVSCVFPRLVGFGDPPQPALPVCFPDRSPCLIQDSKVTELIHSPVLVSFYCCDKIPQEQQPERERAASSRHSPVKLHLRTVPQPSSNIPTGWRPSAQTWEPVGGIGHLGHHVSGLVDLSKFVLS